MNMKKTMEMKILLRLFAGDNPFGYNFSACVDYRGKEYFAVNEVEYRLDPTAHAEIQAIRNACREEKTNNLEGGKIYCSGEPCPMCLTAIAWAGIKEIFYINSYKVAKENNEFYDQSSKRVNKFLNLKRKIKVLK